MKTTRPYSANRSQLWRGSFLIALAAALACFAPSPTTRAREPVGDGNYQSLNRVLTKTVYETAKLTAPDGLGASVSVWRNLALIGGSGSAYIFAFDGTNWNLQTTLTASDGQTGDGFGSSVLISGRSAFVGAPWHGNVGAARGAVYVFSFDGSRWSEQAKLTVEIADGFGYAISLSGNMALIGTYGAPISGVSAAFVFAFDGNAWNEQARLTADDGGYNYNFSRAVSLSGNRALVGDFEDVITFNGAAYIFEFDGTTWTQTAKLMPTDGSILDWFGWSVSLSGDVALIGAPDPSDEGNGRGRGYIFAFDGSTWSQQAEFLSVDARGGWLGYSAALAGTRAFVGAPFYTGGQAGMVYQLSLRQAGWRLNRELLPSDGMPYDHFGAALSVSGNTVFVCAPSHVNVDGSRGAVYVFSGADQ